MPEEEADSVSMVKIYAFSDEAGEDLSAQMRALKRNGLCGPELRGVDGKNIAEISPGAAREIRRRLDGEGLSVFSIGSPIGKMDEAKEDLASHLEKFRRVLDIAGETGAECIRLFSFYVPQGMAPQDFREEAFERFGKLTELAEGYPVTLCHENEKGIYGDSAARCLDLLQSFPAVKAVFDPANFVQCGQDTPEAWRLLKPYVRYMHIKDALAGGFVVPAGAGIGHVPEIVRDFVQNGGNVFSVEPHLKVFNGFGMLERPGEGKRPPVDVSWPDQDSAFDAACAAFRRILADCEEEKG